jgi:hypothetical protein
MFRKSNENSPDIPTLLRTDICGSSPLTPSQAVPSLRVMSRQNEMSRPFRDMSHVRQSLERELWLVLSSKPCPSAPVSGRRIRISQFAVRRLGSTSLETGSMMQDRVLAPRPFLSFVARPGEGAAPAGPGRVPGLCGCPPVRPARGDQAAAFCSAAIGALHAPRAQPMPTISLGWTLFRDLCH